MSDYRKYGTSRANNIIIEDPHKCYVCKAEVPDTVIECPECGFPQNGDEASQRRFLGQLRHDKLEEKRAALRVNHAFHLLLGIPAIFLFLTIAFWQDAGNVLETQISGLIGLVFLSIWIFGRRDPYRAFAVSLGLYALLTIPLVIYKPSIIISSGFWIFGPYIYLPIGLRSFKDWKQLDEYLDGKNSG